MDPLVILERREPLATLTLNRAARHNSLVPALLEELLVALETVRDDPGLGAAVLQANGRSFSTGGDLAGFREQMEDLESYAQTLVSLLNRTIVALMELPIPLVAAVHGLVSGGSLGLVLGCDIVLVAPEAAFTPYYSVVGFSPDGGWTALLPAIIGRQRAAEVLLRNLTITADQAVAWGLASRIVPAERIRDEALRVAAEMASHKAGSIGYIKRLLRPPALDLPNRLETERVCFVDQIRTEEARQGLVRFLEGMSR